MINRQPFLEIDIEFFRHFHPLTLYNTLRFIRDFNIVVTKIYYKTYCQNYSFSSAGFNRSELYTRQLVLIMCSALLHVVPYTAFMLLGASHWT